MDHNRFAYAPMPRRPRLALPNEARAAVWVIPNVEYFPFDLPSTPINPACTYLVPDVIAPLPSAWIVEKAKASCFFGTPLACYLIQKGVDTLVVVGVSTSGCVRASVIDAFSYGFKVFLIEEGCFDRSDFAHAANLFDMDAKYASVITFEEFESMFS